MEFFRIIVHRTWRRQLNSETSCIAAANGSTRCRFEKLDAFVECGKRRGISQGIAFFTF